jgi:hypothetical protein
MPPRYQAHLAAFSIDLGQQRGLLLYAPDTSPI